MGWLNVKEPMYLEYDKRGQPCGRWRRMYGKHVGLSMRKLNIAMTWDEVPDGLKKSMWEDTMNLFHIEENEAKKKVFLSGVAQRFRDFKGKLVSGWITLSRKRTAKKKRGEREGNVIEDSVEPPKKMPYEIWHHITKEAWDAFKSRREDDKHLELSKKASENAKKRKFYQHLGPKTFEEKRRQWKEDGLYPSSTNDDRACDWWCSLHERDEHGNWVIADPETKKVADAVIGWLEKEAAGEFSPEAEKDALYMVLGKDHHGRVKGHGGVRVGLKKVFQADYSRSKSASNDQRTSDIDAIKAELRKELRQEMRQEMHDFFKEVGITGAELNENEPFEQRKKRAASDPSVESALHGSSPPLIPVLEEETSCQLLLPKVKENDEDLMVVADGHAQPRSEHAKIHFKELSSAFFRVSVDDIRDGCKDLELPIPREDASLYTLSDARGSFVAWPCIWVRFSDEIIKKIKKKTPSKDKHQGKKSFDNKQKMLMENEANVEPQSEELQSRELDIRVQTKSGCPSSSSLLNQNEVASLTNHCSWLNTCSQKMVDGHTFEIFLDKDQFHYAEDSTAYITKDDVLEFLSGDMLNVSFIQLFMCALYEELHDSDSLQRIGWLCPQEIRGAKCLADSSDVKYYLENSIQQCRRAGKVIIIAPYHQDTHWMLVVISTTTNTVYQFDSARVEPPRMLLLKSCLNNVLMKLSGAALRRDSIPKWKSMKCAQQQGAVECGYYVMRYIYDIVSSSVEVKDLETIFNTPREGPFTSTEINEVRDKCAAIITDTYL